jgi:hypothetical protein
MEEPIKELLGELTSYFSWLHGKSPDEKEIPKVVMQVWKNEVFGVLDDDEIEIAKKKAIATLKWMPSPQEFTQLITGDEEAEALQEWLKILQALRLAPTDRPAIVDTLSGHAKLALQTLGGLSLLAEARVESLHSTLKNQFITAWKSFKKSTNWKKDKTMQDLIKPTAHNVLALSPAIAPEIDIEAEQQARDKAVSAIAALYASKKQGLSKAF